MKLSPKMAEGLKDLQAAKYYYKAPQFESLRKKYTDDKIDGRYTATGYENMSSRYSRLVDGTIALNGNSSTIKALEKRGLVEILTLGGYQFDRVRVIGQEPAEQLKEIVRVEVMEKRTERSGRVANYHTTYFADENAINVLKADLESKTETDRVFEILTVEKIVPTVWEWD